MLTKERIVKALPCYYYRLWYEPEGWYAMPVCKIDTEQKIFRDVCGNSVQRMYDVGPDFIEEIQLAREGLWKMRSKPFKATIRYLDGKETFDLSATFCLSLGFYFEDDGKTLVKEFPCLERVRSIEECVENCQI